MNGLNSFTGDTAQCLNLDLRNDVACKFPKGDAIKGVIKRRSVFDKVRVGFRLLIAQAFPH